MIKSNPLFHDSTVTSGANVQTQFEIHKVDLKEGQTVCLKLTVDDDVKCIEMTPKAEGVFHTSAWIKHRKKIAYQFFIQRGGELLYATAPTETLALHTVVEKWRPLEGTDWKKDFSKAPSASKTVQNDFQTSGIDFVKPAKKETTENYLDGLLEKWDL